MTTSTIIYIAAVTALLGLLVGLIIYAKKRSSGKKAAAKTGKTVQPGKEEIIALPTEKLIDVASIRDEFLLTDAGDLVAILEVNPVIRTSNSRPEALDLPFVSAIERMPPKTVMQFVQMPIPNQVDELSDRYARHGHDWRSMLISAQTSGADPKKQAQLQNRYFAATQLGATILKHGGDACYRASLIVLTTPGRTAFGKQIPEKVIRDFRTAIQEVRGVFDNHGLTTEVLQPEFSLHYLWYAYHPDSGAQAAIDQAEERFAHISIHGQAPPAEMSALTIEDLNAALSAPDQHVKRVLAPPVLDEGDSWVEFRQKNMLLYFIPDFKTSLPRLSRLLGVGGMYYNRLFVSYYVTAPAPEEIALQARKASTAKQAQQVIGQKLGTLPSYRQQEDVLAIEQARYGAETEKLLPRLLGLYIGVLVDPHQMVEQRADFESTLQSAGLVFTPAKWSAMSVWKSMLPLGQRHHSFEDRNVFSQSLAALNPVTSQTLFAPEGEFLGFTEISENHSMPVAIVRKRGTEIVPSDALVGAPGSGKSMTLKWWVTEWLVRNQNVIVIDPKLEFGPVVEILGGSNVDAVGTTGFNLLRFENYPLDPDSQLGQALARMTFEDNLAAIKSLYRAAKGGKASYVSGTESNLLIRALQHAMKNKDMAPDDPTTWAPDRITFGDVYQVLVRELLHDDPATVKVIMNNLMQYGDPTGQYYTQYNTPTPLNLDDDLVVITFGLSQFSADQRLTALAYHFALRMAAQHSIRKFILGEEVKPYHIVIDEASQMLTSPSLVSSVARMLSLLPAYGISVHLAFQDMFALERADALGAEENAGSMNSLLGTIPAYWLFNQEPQSAAKAVQLLRLPQNEQGAIAGKRPGQCLIVFPRAELRIPISVKVPQAFLEIYKTDPDAMRQLLDRAIAR